jgi:transposase
MGQWVRIALDADQQRIVNDERQQHPLPHVRGKMQVLWLLHCGATREQAATMADVSRSTVQRYVRAFHEGGFDGLRRWNVAGPVSDMAQYRELICQSFAERPVATIGEACARIEELTSLKRGRTQVEKFLKGLGFKWQCIRAIPVPPKKTWQNMSPRKPNFSTPN